MPVLTIKLPGKDRRITFETGRSVREVLDETDLRVRTGCNGMGACGLCRIKIMGGDAGGPSANELSDLGEALLSQGVRLACQVKADRDLQIEILNPSPPSLWHSIDKRSATAPTGGQRISGLKEARSLGAAVDLGTTHISLTLVDLIAGRRLAGRRGLNPQEVFGHDVMTRLMSAKSAGETAGQAETMGRMVIQAIGDGLRDMSTRDGIDLQKVAHVAIVGNTAMLALLSGQNYQLLLDPSYWVRTIDCLPAETSHWAAAWGTGPGTEVRVIPPFAGFVGSDLISGVIATQMMERGTGTLLIDFGTNSEMALWDGKKLWVTSAAGGPAFEGSGIGCGMPAGPGAVWRVKASGATGELEFDVIGGAEPRGLCGSGLVDLLGCLLRNGTLNSKGQFASSVPGSGFKVNAGARELVLTKKDIDIFQRAKAAIGVAVRVLLDRAGMGHDELRRIIIGGSFGSYLDPDNARLLGLLPDVLGLLIETAGNTALDGCEALLLSHDPEGLLQEMRDRAIILNLSDCADFGDLFLEHLYLQPVKKDMDHGQIAI